ncbi:kinase-like protein [Gymnopus androsaceus JB14]|uniref:Kinase-like protein n=1 Tax=Gymnopus androsaceus JB14 TaxID=1447944 RepID=A0A6A4GZK1_9AGAR|nr:kinase-like protein [Gymnopus androsaceus JB14]
MGSVRKHWWKKLWSIYRLSWMLSYAANTTTDILFLLLQECIIRNACGLFANYQCRIRSFQGGGFADIYRGNMGERRVCLKVLRLVIEENKDTRDKIRKEFCKEALIWRQLKHPNILPLLGVNAELFSPSFCLISPWMENKNIITYLKNNPGHNRHNVLSEVASGLYYLHSRDPPILHGDIRGANILVTDDLHCCLADFGLSLIISDSRTLSNASTSGMTKGTIRWMAPELIIPARRAPNDTSRDVYAFGCTVLEVTHFL